MKKVFILSLFIIVLIFVLCGISFIDVGYVGFKVKFGQVTSDILPSGVYWKTPFIESMKRFNTKMQRVDVKTSGASKDLQDVALEIALNYSLSANAVIDLYKTVGTGYEKIFLYPVCNESIKAVTATYSAEELITQRDKLSTDIRLKLEEKLNTSGIVVNAVNITNLNFSDSFNQAIEAKQVAQQNALKAQQDLERVKFEAEQKVAQARAEAESYKLKNNEISDKVLQMSIIEKWNGVLPVITDSKSNILDISSLLGK